MRVLNVHSKQHNWMYDKIWLPTLTAVEPGARIETVQAHQFSETATYGDKGWWQQMSFKARIVRAMIHHGEPFLYADTDIVFLKPFLDDLKERMQGYDAVFQYTSRKDCPYCAGFAAYTSSPACMDLLEKTLKIMEDGDTVGDQHALNRAAKQVRGLKIGLLSEDYWHPGMGTDDPQQWTPDKPVNMPNTAKIAHATWVMAAHKPSFFRKVREQTEARKEWTAIKK